MMCPGDSELCLLMSLSQLKRFLQRLSRKVVALGIHTTTMDV